MCCVCGGGRGQTNSTRSMAAAQQQHTTRHPFVKTTTVARSALPPRPGCVTPGLVTPSITRQYHNNIIHTSRDPAAHTSGGSQQHSAAADLRQLPLCPTETPPQGLLLACHAASISSALATCQRSPVPCHNHMSWAAGTSCVLLFWGRHTPADCGQCACCKNSCQAREREQAPRCACCPQPLQHACPRNPAVRILVHVGAQSPRAVDAGP